MRERIAGMVVPLVTPLQPNGCVCRDSVHRIIESVAPWASALLPCLSSGEGTKLSFNQWQDMVTYSVQPARGLPVFPGALVETTAELLKRAAFAADAGAAGITLVVPSFAGWDPGRAVDYFSQLAAKLPIPIFLYNQESVAPAEGVIEALISICRMDCVVAIKESSRRPEVAAALHREKIPSAVFQGWEDLCYQSAGVDGNALALSNLEPRLCAEMHRAPSQHKQQEIISLCEKYGLFDDIWYVSLKTELCKRGILVSNLAAA